MKKLLTGSKERIFNRDQKSAFAILIRIDNLMKRIGQGATWPQAKMIKMGEVGNVR
jgi:hypothetical protein